MTELNSWALVTTDFYSVTGRITFALARDGAFPWSKLLAETHERLESPVNSLVFVAAIGTVILFLPLLGDGGETAFFAIISHSTLGFQVSYSVPIALNLLSRDPAAFPATTPGPRRLVPAHWHPGERQVPRNLAQSFL